ncbi:MAG: phosphoribosylformylglycinamidine synthase subunit PurS [Candidatus Syntrophosphaera sp.]|jgi:phosphoribosylformylglycinamidine synthase subunit PurS
MILAKIYVSLKPNVLDPQGKAVTNSLHQLGYDKVLETRVSKYIEIRFREAERRQVEQEVEKICNDLLANPNTENYSYTLETVGEDPA